MWLAYVWFLNRKKRNLPYFSLYRTRDIQRYRQNTILNDNFPKISQNINILLGHNIKIGSFRILKFWSGGLLGNKSNKIELRSLELSGLLLRTLSYHRTTCIHLFFKFFKQWYISYSEISYSYTIPLKQFFMNATVQCSLGKNFPFGELHIILPKWLWHIQYASSSIKIAILTGALCLDSLLY